MIHENCPSTDFLYFKTLCSVFRLEPQRRNSRLTRWGRTAAFKRCTEDTWRVPTAQQPVCVSTPTAGSRVLGQTNGESLCFLALLTPICSSSVRTQSLCSLWLRKTAISALCSLCCTSDSPFSHFLAFIRFNSSASWAISLAILVCTVSRSLLYLLIPLWLAELNNILKKEEKALSTNFPQHQNNKFQSLKQREKKKKRLFQAAATTCPSVFSVSNVWQEEKLMEETNQGMFFFKQDNF